MQTLQEVERLHREGARNFRSVDASGTELTAAMFSECDFGYATLRECRMSEVQFRMCDLSTATFRRALLYRGVRFVSSSLRRFTAFESSLAGVVFDACDMTEAVLESARLENVIFINCDLRGAKLNRAVFNRVEFTNCHLDGVSLGGATFLLSDIAEFCEARNVWFGDALTIDWRTISRSVKAADLEIFLAKAGMPEVFAVYSASCARAVNRDQLFHLMRSTFISYGGPDAAFALRLRDDLSRNGVDTFFFATDATPGDKLHHVMRDGINRYDRIIVICSAGSLKRVGVRYEIEEAFAREARDGGAAYVIPVALDDYVFDASDQFAELLRERVVADFRDEDRYTIALTRLLSALSRDVLDGA